MLYLIYFIVGGTIMVLALLLSQSKYLFLSGIITALPILTLINMGMQMKHMKADTFHNVLQNTVFGAVGMLLFTVLAFLLTNWCKPGIAVLSALLVYAIFMLCGKFIMSLLT
ncbi:membrane protein [Lysinibacillus sphaericus]|uniref:DUF3147 domain-containing protein n=1 Tax=Lysinibacillus sphaericus TaxID=1421 RepID=A0A2S5CZV7_LYSSH|nr:hypothetical protein [Lysinibacillus sphaericus]OEC01190.1 membrane protein [Lysinibacillus sphaericus]POZ56278.1 hypothetical protein LYSIN_01061 [Lysinibacillus sphaericus]